MRFCFSVTSCLSIGVTLFSDLTLCGLEPQAAANWSWRSVMCQMNQLLSPPLFFPSVLCVLRCGVTREPALPLACHPPRPSMESRGGGGAACVCVGGGHFSTYGLKQLLAEHDTSGMCLPLTIWHLRTAANVDLHDRLLIILCIDRLVGKRKKMYEVCWTAKICTSTNKQTKKNTNHVR